MSEAMLTIEAVMERTGFGRTKIYDMIGKGDFPKPAKIGAASRWRALAIDNWIASQFADTAQSDAAR
ncbi:AlpA family phage regulatory protein [Citromicrobium bathyomarinum]